MVASKNLFNASGQQCAVELIERCYAVTLDLTQADVVLTPSATYVTVTVNQKSDVLQGQRYEGTAQFSYHKLSALECLPLNMVYTDVYPVSFESWSSNFLANYGLLFEEGDFGIVTSEGVQPLVNGTSLRVALDSNKRIWLETLPTSNRWISGERIPVTVLYNDIYQTELRISGDAPDAINTSDYSYQYQITGGVEPYHSTIIEGTIPFTLDPETCVLSGLAPEGGALTWKIGVTDSAGNYVEISDSLNVLAGDMSFSNASSLTVEAGEYIDVFLTTVGGQSPKRYMLLNSAPGLYLSSNGRLTGTSVPTMIDLQVRCIDANNTSIEDTITLTVTGRDLEVVKTSLRNKLQGGHWYQFYSGRTDLGNYKVRDLLSGNDLVYFGGEITSTVDAESPGGDVLASLKIHDALLMSEVNFVPLANDFTIYLTFEGPVDQPNSFIVGTSDGLNGWSVAIDETGTGATFKARMTNGTVDFRTDEGVSETLRSSLVISKLGRNLWMLANNNLKHFVLPYETQIVERASSKLSFGKMFNFTGFPYEGSFETAVILRYGTLPDEFDLLTNDQHGQQLATLKTTLGMIPFQSFPYQELTITLEPGSSQIAGSCLISAGHSPFEPAKFLDHVLDASSTLHWDAYNPRKLNYNLKLIERETTTTYVAITDSAGRVSRLKINIVANE